MIEIVSADTRERRRVVSRIDRIKSRRQTSDVAGNRRLMMLIYIESDDKLSLDVLRQYECCFARESVGDATDYEAVGQLMGQV